MYDELAELGPIIVKKKEVCHVSLVFSLKEHEFYQKVRKQCEENAKAELKRRAAINGAQFAQLKAMIKERDEAMMRILLAVQEHKLEEAQSLLRQTLPMFKGNAGPQKAEPEKAPQPPSPPAKSLFLRGKS